MKYLKPEATEALNRSFLSETLESTSIDLRTFAEARTTHDYYSAISVTEIRWKAGTEQVDPDGNVWQPYDLSVTSNICSCYSLNTDQYRERAECMSMLTDLFEEIKAVVPGTVMALTLDPQQRVARDTKLKYESDCQQLARFLAGEGHSLRQSLRINGKTRVFRGELVNKLGLTSGTFEVRINEGPRSNPERRYRKYTVMIPSDLTRYCSIKRIH